MTFEELRNVVCRYIDENREAYNETGDECYRAVKEELLHILGLIDSVDHEPVVKDKLTLTELARELRKIFQLNYLAYGEIFIGGGCYPVLTIGVLPLRLEVRDEGGEGVPCYIHEWVSDGVTNSFFPVDLAVSIDLSEYEDEDGDVDYSKCIVEVSDASE